MKKLLENEINGVSFFFHKFPENKKINVKTKTNEVKLFLLFKGKISLLSRRLVDRAVIGIYPGNDVVFSVNDAEFVEVLIKVEKNKKLFRKEPYILRYENAEICNDYTKSEKAVNKILLRPGIFPHISIGCVETDGPDKVLKHNHPHIEQVFITYEDNKMVMIVDDKEKHMKGKEIFHIPCGVSHEVIANASGHIHYMRIDFTLDEVGEEYIKDFY